MQGEHLFLRFHEFVHDRVAEKLRECLPWANVQHCVVTAAAIIEEPDRIALVEALARRDGLPEPEDDEMPVLRVRLNVNDCGVHIKRNHLGEQTRYEIKYPQRFEQLCSHVASCVADFTQAPNPRSAVVGIPALWWGELPRFRARSRSPRERGRSSRRL
ncbi:unnamed protein product [Effrenium voratum]|nr:unnamed protein product [Effrenium voratum]